ncbi:MAG: hypothetical protein ACHP9Z_04305 [Streptosporangiales bacterium]
MSWSSRLPTPAPRLTISVDFTGHGIGKVLVPLLVRREARKEMPDNMTALKRMIETN